MDRDADTLVQEEPTTALDPERAGRLAGIGIVHGQPFAPDERRRATLDTAARTAAAISRALVYAPATPRRGSSRARRGCRPSSAAATSSSATAPACLPG